MPSTDKVLLFGTMGSIGPTVLDNLLQHGINAVLAGFPQCLFRDEPGYRRELGRVVDSLHPDVIIPVGHALAMAGMALELRESGIRVIVERPEVIRLLDSKVQFSRLASELGIPQPRIYSDPGDVDFGDAVFGKSASGKTVSVDDASDRARVVFKRDVSYAGHGVKLPATRAALDNLISHQSPGEPYLIEEYIEGEDYSVDAIRGCDGSFVCGSYRILASRCDRGPSTLRESVSCPAIEAYARRIMEHLDYHGLCGFDFRLSRDGHPFILEANPRFTGGLSTQIASGFDIPFLLLSML